MCLMRRPAVGAMLGGVRTNKAGLTSPALTVKEASLMRRIIMLFSAAAFMALMMVASAAPAMANNLFNNDLDNFGVFNDRGDLFDGCIGSTIFGHCTGVGALDDDVRFFDGFRHHDRFGDDEDLDTIRVGGLRCLVEDRDDVEFCVNRHTGEIFRP